MKKFSIDLFIIFYLVVIFFAIDTPSLQAQDDQALAVRQKELFQQGDETLNKIIPDLVTQKKSVMTLLHQQHQNESFAKELEKIDQNLASFVEKELQEHADIDYASIARAQNFYHDYKKYFISILEFYSLPITFIPENSAEVLLYSGKLVAETTMRKKHTLLFLEKVFAPNSFLPEGDALTWALKIRFLHSMKNYEFTHSRQSELAPINQMGLYITLLSFSAVVIDGLEKYQIDVSQQEREDLFYFWEVVGHHMGLHPELHLPKPEEAMTVLNQLLDPSIKKGASLATKKLAQSLVESCIKDCINKSHQPTTDEVLSNLQFFLGDKFHQFLFGPSADCSNDNVSDSGPN